MDFESSEEEDEDEEEDDGKPQERIKLKDGATIINYEVDVEEEEEEEIVYAGGIKGIRALRKRQGGQEGGYDM
jgi:hypothetical protein